MSEPRFLDTETIHKLHRKSLERFGGADGVRDLGRHSLEPELDAVGTSGTAGDGAVPVVDAHTMNPEVVLATLSRLGGSVGRVRIVGCQPASLQDGIGLTPAVQAAVGPAADLCIELASEAVQPARKGIHP